MAAEQALRRGMAALRLSPGALARMAKSAPEKKVLAWWLRRGTTVSLRWLSQRLGMGHFTRVSQAISEVRRRPSRLHGQLQRRLLRLSDQKARNE